MKYKVEGTVMPILSVTLDKGESVISERGAMIWMDDGIGMDTHAHGGFRGGVGRLFMGESFFVTRFTAEKDHLSISFGPSAPGKIIDFEITKGRELICQKDAFLAGTSGIKLDPYVKKKIMVGFLGGEGFVLQRISGEGHAFLEIDGEVFSLDLAEGQKIKVDTGSIAAFEKTVDYDITRVKGLHNLLFGGEGMFLATLEGPGKIYLQSMSMPSLAERLMPYFQPRKK